MYACVHVYIVLQQPVIGTKVCNKDFAPRVKTQGIPKHIEAATREIPWYMCIYAAPCLSMFCLILAVLSSQMRASSCYIMILYITRSHMRHKHKISHVDNMHSMQTRQDINTNTTNVGRFVKAFGFRYFLYMVLRLRGYMQCYLECACMRVLTSEHRVSIGLCKWRPCMTLYT